MVILMKLLLTNAQASRLRKAFANGSSGNIKLSKTKLQKIGQALGFLARLSGPLLKYGLPLIGNVHKQFKTIKRFKTIRINRSSISCS